MVLLIKQLHFDYPGKWSYKQGWSYPRGGLVLQIIQYTFTMVPHQNLSELGGTKLLIRVLLIYQILR
jgi:hypothetical protein